MKIWNPLNHFYLIRTIKYVLHFCSFFSYKSYTFFFVSAFSSDEKNYFHFRITFVILFFMYINFLFHFQFIFSFYFQYSIFFSSMDFLQRFCLKLQISRIWTTNLWSSSIQISKQVNYIIIFVSLLFYYYYFIDNLFIFL